MRYRCPILLLVALGSACGDEERETPPAIPDDFRLVTVVSGLENPVYVAAPPGDSTRLFVVEKAGRVVIVRNGAIVTQPFLDITGQTTKGDEQGLLGMAFAPDYATSGRFYVSYTAPGGGPAGHSVISRFTVSTNPDSAGDDEHVLLQVNQPYSNHNGGMITFGPDGYLYIGFGDGGDGGDPLETGQDRTDLLGSMLRIDVSGSDYTIPAGNPFVANAGARDELWNYGLRNPWRFSFDRETGDLYIADVGQGQYEEVDVVDAGAGGGQNFGWDDMEGDHCYEDSSCDDNPALRPVIEYDHGGGRCAVTGGYVYRGSAIPAIAGRYFYADYCSGALSSFSYAGGGTVSETRSHSGLSGSPTSFGEDGKGELYVTTQSGRLLRFSPPE
jgi:glucose/arabinose dehydrogenase